MPEFDTSALHTGEPRQPAGSGRAGPVGEYVARGRDPSQRASKATADSRLASRAPARADGRQASQRREPRLAEQGEHSAVENRFSTNDFEILFFFKLVAARAHARKPTLPLQF
jgi:hypothetical protein